jgi:hypothetical protein
MTHRYGLRYAKNVTAGIALIAEKASSFSNMDTVTAWAQFPLTNSMIYFFNYFMKLCVIYFYSNFKFYCQNATL